MQFNERKAGILLSYISLIISTVVNIVNVPLFLHFIGVGEYGLYQTMGSLIVYFSILDFGIPATIVFFYSKYRALNDTVKMENILAICTRLFAVITVVILMLGSWIYLFLDSIYANSLSLEQLVNAKHIYIVLLINIGCTVPFQILNAVIIAYEKFIFLRCLTIAIVVGQAIAMVAAVYNFRSALCIVIVQTIFNILMVVIRCYYCFKCLKVKIKLHFFDKILFKGIIRYSFFIFLNVIVEQLYWRSNLIILSIVGNSTEVAAYSITFQIAYNYMILSTAITGVFLPSITSMVSKGEGSKSLSNMFIKVGRIQFILLSCVVTGFILFGKQFISLWSVGKSGFENSYVMTLILILPITIDLIQGLAQTILQALNKFYFRVIIFFIVNFVSICIAIPFAKLYGGMGCSWVTGLSLIPMIIILNLYYNKNIGLDMISFWKQILTMSIPLCFCVLSGVLINFIKLPGSAMELGLKIFLYIIVYIVIMWKLVMNEYEKNLLRKPLDKITSIIIEHKR